MDKGIRVTLLDDHDLRGLSQMVEMGVCSSELLDCVLRDFLMVPPKYEVISCVCVCVCVCMCVCGVCVCSVGALC